VSARFAVVAVPFPVDETYDYALREGVPVEPGARVLVPFRGRDTAAVVLELRDRPSGPVRGPVRFVSQVVDAEPVLDAALLDVVLRAARDALCPPGLALAAAIPPGTAPRPGQRVELLPAGRRALERGEAPGTLGRVLWSLGRAPLSEASLRARFPAAVPILDRFERIGWIRRTASTDPPRVRVKTELVYRLAPGVTPTVEHEALARAPKRRALLEILCDGARALPASAPLRALVLAGLVVPEEREVLRGVPGIPLRDDEAIPEPTSAQREAVKQIAQAIEEKRDDAFLLYGITGSGKTEVYLRAADEALSRGRGVIVLVPEISLTHQVVDRFRARFGERVAVLHSGLSGGERYDQWRRVREGHAPIAVGARSAVFAPIADPGLIVIDEEHDAAYKSEEGFRYHARDVAELRARSARCPLVLGSATPDVETFYRAERGELQRLLLPARVTKRPLPQVEIVDMGAEQRRRGKRSLLSTALRQALAATLAAKQQAILFLNRRGFATLVYCYACGHAIRCKRCDVSLVYHATGVPPRRLDPEEGELRCHYCGHVEPPHSTCPACGSPEGGLLGFGTERVHEEVRAMFPHARVARFDRDTTGKKGEQRRILTDFHRGAVDVLVGTQMVAKGHDVPGVTLVGVIHADLGLHFPDFRASERTFQLLTQVAGRAGRGDEPGRVVIQTFLPDHYAIALARTHDYPSFFREELARRKPHGYPPFRALLQVALSGKRLDRVEQAARELAQLATSAPRAEPTRDFAVLGPAPLPVAKIRDRFRYQLVLQGAREEVREVARTLLARSHPGVEVRVDPAPLQML
jgi:primosomal protein N' (replication factor Y)